jgi:hypothetical protein
MFEYLRKVLSPERDEQVSQEIEASATKSTSKKISLDCYLLVGDPSQ